MTTIKRVGFLGTGIMGAPMAHNIARAGFAVSAWNRDRQKAEALAAHGINVAESAAAASADQDAVVVMLSSGPVCDAVLDGGDGRDGALAALAPGALLVVMSSIPVETARAQAERCAARGVHYLDAPVSGGEAGAQAATLSIMAGGTAEAFAQGEALLSAMGTPLHIGAAGTGQLTKLVNQLTVACTIAAVAEALLLAERGGADLAKVRQALLGGFAQSKILDMHGQRMIAGDFAPGGPAKHQVKDTTTAKAFAEGLGLNLPVLGLVDQMYADMVENGDAELDHSGLLRELRRRNGLAPGGAA